MANKTTTAYAASLVVAANPAVFYGCTGYNSLASDQFIQVHDAASLPADGAIPKISFKIRASDNFALDYDTRGRQFTNGIVICNSTTQNTLTIGAANLWIDAQVEAIDG